MNDMLIIVLCIFLMSILWTFYFKNLKEGVDNIDNYVMPISFSDNRSTNPSRDESKTINVPGQINSEGDIKLMKNTNVEGALNVKNNLDIRGITNLNGEIKIPNEVPIHFGAGQNKEVNAGKISYGSYGWHDHLSIVGAGYGPRKVRLWDDLSVSNDVVVDRNLKVSGNTNTNTLNAGNTAVNSLYVSGKTDTKSLKVGDIDVDIEKLFVIQNSGIRSIQVGLRGRKGWAEREYFPKKFPTNNVFVFTSVIGNDPDLQTTIRVFNVDYEKFDFQQKSANRGGRVPRTGWTYNEFGSDFPFAWIAFCI
jgi:hypothetical protein